MSFFGSHDEARSIVHKIEESTNVGHGKGAASSRIRDGHSEPGVSVKNPMHELVPKRTSVRPRTSKLTRKYAAS